MCRRGNRTKAVCQVVLWVIIANVAALAPGIHGDEREVHREGEQAAEPKATALLAGTFDALAVKTGTTSTAGAALVAGWEFRVRTKMTVTHLGICDVGSEGLDEPHDVAIWDLAQPKKPLTMARVAIGNDAPLEGAFRMTSTQPVELEPGKKYAVVAHYRQLFDGNASFVNPRGVRIAFAPHVEPIGRRYTFPHQEMAYPNESQVGAQHATIGPTFRFRVTDAAADATAKIVPTVLQEGGNTGSKPK